MAALTSDEMEQILLDVTLGRKGKLNSPEAVKFRKQMDAELAEIIAKGGTVHIPHEHPHLGEAESPA